MCVLLLAVVEMMPEWQVLEEFDNVVEHVVMITEKMKMIKMKSIRSQRSWMMKMMKGNRRLSHVLISRFIQ